MGEERTLDAVASALEVGASGRQSFVQSGLVVGSAGAVIQALTIATACAHAEWGTSEERSSSLGKAVLLGQIGGGLVWSLVADVLGRKEACCLSCVVVAAATAACGFAASFFLLRLSCFAAGFGLAGAAVVPTLVTIERLPPPVRGRYAVALAWFATVGAAGAACAHAVVEAAGARAWGGASTPRWRSLCAAVALLPFGAGVAAANRMPESIPWLVSKNRISAARKVAERAAVVNAVSRLEGARRYVDRVLATLDDVTSCSLDATSVLRSLRAAVRAPSVCAWGLAFLVAFGSLSVVSLVRLEFDGNDDARSAAFRRRLDDTCPSLDYSIVGAALLSELVAVAIAAHLVDAVGRRPTLAGLCAAAAAGVLVLAAPEYFPDTFQQAPPSRSTLVAAMMTARGALAAAASVVALVVAEMRATPDRATAAAAAYVLAKLGGLLSTYWVVSPNPVSTISLLVTLVDVSAAWAALALPVETARKPLDTIVPDKPATSCLLGVADLDELSNNAKQPNARRPATSEGDQNPRGPPYGDGGGGGGSEKSPRNNNLGAASTSSSTDVVSSEKTPLLLGPTLLA
ncbi:hypothetical protein CTAYLR_004177 [Chrysophaeum taylorii]|uniref:Major facilitator superfamily (MFS) profile domain-containing protein n=1 Tax=Chrysophaeum taylorii TaxID=2483200 RepID=A0AAD7UMG2_9STRA|nr:hypothetical protein CTAYLR_004177 [Chrysophaeum taylorii]